MNKLPVPILAAVAAVLLAACGGGGSAASGSTTSTTTPGRGFRNAAFTSCLKQHGITLPAAGFGGRRPTGATGTGGRPTGATGGGGFQGGFAGGGPSISIPGVSNQKVQSAFNACRSKLPNGGQFGGRFGGANAGAVRAYLSCLRDHGVTVPTTTSGSTAGSGFARSGLGGPGSELRAVRNDPKFAAANKTCRALLPTFGGSSTTTPSG